MQTTLTSADKPRLTTQQEHVEAIMGDGRWRTLGQIVAELRDRGVHASEAGASARLRQMRTRRWSVERRRVPDGNGLHEYRATFAIPRQQQISEIL